MKQTDGKAGGMPPEDWRTRRFPPWIIAFAMGLHGLLLLIPLVNDLPTPVESTLIEIAQITGGEYFRARDNAALRDTFNSIDSLEKTEVQSHTVVDADEFYPWLIGATFVIAFIGISLRGLNPPPMPS